MPGFRLCNKAILLTYPHCDRDPEQFMKKLLEVIETTYPKPEISYMVVSREDHHESDGKHMHVYIEWVAPFRTTNERAFDIDGFHCNIRKVSKTKWKSVEYAKKDGEFKEYKPENCPQCTLDTMDKNEKRIFLKTHDPLKLYDENLISEEQCVRIIKAKQFIETQRDNTEREKPVVLWFYGGTGSGKTRTATEIARESGKSWWMTSDPDLKWFDGYHGQEYAIIDDFRRQGIKFNHVLRLADRYPYRVQVKGGYVNWCPKVIIFTCPVHPHDCYQYIDKEGNLQDWDNLDQFIRRIDAIIEF